MASFVILNSTRLGADLFEAGSIVDADRDPTIVQRLQASRAVLVPTTAGSILAVADEARVRRRRGASLEEIDAFMIANGLLYLAPSPVSGFTVFVFQPHGTPGGNVFDDWATLVATVGTVAGPKIVFFDDTFGACEIPAGTWSLGPDTLFKGPLRRVPVVCSLLDGAKVTGLVGIDDLGLEKSGATAFQMFTAGATFRLWGNAYMLSTGVEILLMFNANPLVIELHGASAFITGNPVVRMKQPGGSLRLRAFDAASVDRDSVAAAAGVSVRGEIVNAAAFVHTSQALVQPTGTISVDLYERADREFYDDTAAPPALGAGTTQDAIDALKGAAFPLGSATPQAVGTATPGTALAASHEDHVHAHGSQGGGSEHAAVIAGGANGFMTGTDKTRLDGMATGAAALGVATPQPIGTATPGTAAAGSHEDHVHAHGSQGGGSEHATVIAGGAAGFMSGADKTRLDGMATGATNTPLSNVNPLGNGVAAPGTGTAASREDHVHPVAVESADLVLRPLFVTAAQATRALANTYVGAIFQVPQRTTFTAVRARLTAAQIGAVVRVTIYQQASGLSGVAALVATGAFTTTVGGAQDVTIPIVGTLVAGFCHVLIGIDGANTATMRTHGNAAFDGMTQLVPVGKAPVTYTTAIAVNATPPATFDAATAGTASTADIAAILRIGT